VESSRSPTSPNSICTLHADVKCSAALGAEYFQGSLAATASQTSVCQSVCAVGGLDNRRSGGICHGGVPRQSKRRLRQNSRHQPSCSNLTTTVRTRQRQAPGTASVPVRGRTGHLDHCWGMNLWRHRGEYGLVRHKCEGGDNPTRFDNEASG
jgi:hypothetical protein